MHTRPTHPRSLQVLGSGSGVYDPATHAAQLNTKNPPFRDTATLPQNGWVVLRFVADNPGVSGARRRRARAMVAAAAEMSVRPSPAVGH